MDLCLVGLLVVFLFGWFCCFDCVFDCCVLGLLLLFGCLSDVVFDWFVAYLLLLHAVLRWILVCGGAFARLWLVVWRFCLLWSMDWLWFCYLCWFAGWVVLLRLCVFCVDLTGLVVSVGCYASVVLTSGLRVVDESAWIGLWLLVDCGCVVCVCYAFVFDARL